METPLRVTCRSLTGILLALAFLASCSGMRPYANTLEKNLHIRTETQSGSFLSTVRAAVDIYRVDAGCNREYQGTVGLDEPSLAVGIPADGVSYLVFTFSSYSFLANSSGLIRYGTLLKPRAGYTYDIRVSYKDNIYNVVIREYAYPSRSEAHNIW